MRLLWWRIFDDLAESTRSFDREEQDNRLTIKREAVEAHILTALRGRLMTPAMFAEFCQEFTKEMNWLRMAASASLAGKRSEFAKIERQLQKLLKTLLDDGDSKTIVRNMQALEARQEALKAELSQADGPAAPASRYDRGLSPQD